MRFSLFFVSILLTSNLFAQPSSLNPGFGQNGRALVNIDKRGDDYFFARSFQVTPDGKMLIGGRLKNEFAVQRLQKNGNYDSSFGFNGLRFFDFGTVSQIASGSVEDIVRYPDGRMLLIGTSGTGVSLIHKYTSPFSLVAVRLLPNGDVDTSFAVGGKFIFTPVGLGGYGCSGLLQPDGKIVISMRAGFYETSQMDDRSLLLRLNDNGTIDPSFNGGSFILPQAYVTQTVYPPGDRMPLAIQTDGNLLVGAIVAEQIPVSPVGFTYRNSPAIFRYKPNGKLDSSFAENGRLLSRFGYDNYDVRCIEVQSDTKILVSGSVSLAGNKSAWIIFRLKPNGSLDSSFAVNGIFIFQRDTWLSGAIGGIKITDNNTITVAGCHINTFRFCYLDIIRLNQDGTIDSSFADQTIARSTSLYPDNYFTDSKLVIDYDQNIAAIGLHNTYGVNDGHLIVRTKRDGSFFLEPGLVESYRFYNSASKNVDSNNNFGSADRLMGMAVLKSGRMLLAGNTVSEGIQSEKIAMSMLDPSGKIDSSFGNAGRSIVKPSGNNSWTRIFYQTSDQRFLLSDKDNSIILVDSTGKIDSGFALNGLAKLNFPGVNGYPAIIRDVVEQSDHKILVLFPTQLLRLLSDGSLDNSFATNGVLNLNAPFGCAGVKVKLQPDGKILVGAASTYSNFNYIFRCNQNGEPDLGFGDAGGGYGLTRTNIDLFIEPNYSEILQDFLVLPDGSIMVVTLKDRASGFPNPNNVLIEARGGYYRGIILYKLKPNGVMDRSFGNIPNPSYYFGTAHLQLPYLETIPTSLVLAADGRIAISSFFYNGVGWDAGMVFVDINGHNEIACAPNGIVTAGQDNIIQYRRNNYFSSEPFVPYNLALTQKSDGSFLMAATQQGLNADMGVYNILASCPPKPAINSINSGNWNATSTWDCNCIPVFSDNVVIKQGHTVSVTSAMGTIYCKKLTVESGGTISLGANANFKQVVWK